jgi:hypothetical protein
MGYHCLNVKFDLAILYQNLPALAVLCQKFAHAWAEGTPVFTINSLILNVPRCAVSEKYYSWIKSKKAYGPVTKVSSKDVTKLCNYFLDQTGLDKIFFISARLALSPLNFFLLRLFSSFYVCVNAAKFLQKLLVLKYFFNTLKPGML